MVCTSWAAVLGSRTRVDADNRSLTNPLTGEPDAGDPPVRFGGRGSGQPLSLPLSLYTSGSLSPARVRFPTGRDQWLKMNSLELSSDQKTSFNTCSEVLSSLRKPFSLANSSAPGGRLRQRR